MEDDIKLARHEEDASDKIHGFYRTAEGRTFLRTMYRRYLARVSSIFGDTKIAEMIADENVDRRGEVRRTRAALRRWADEGQSELWLKDAGKTLRVMKRLEAQIMLEPATAEVCDDRAASIRALDTANALAIFFHGAKPSKVQSAPSHEVRDVEGIFQIVRVTRGGLVDDDGTYSAKTFCKFSRHETFQFLLVQEVTVPAHIPGERPNFTRRRGGFAFVLPSMKIVRFMIEYADPTNRWIDTYRVLDVSYTVTKDGLKPDFSGPDMRFIKAFVTADDIKGTTFEGSGALWDDETALHRSDTDLAKSLDQYFSSIMWDIPL